VPCGNGRYLPWRERSDFLRDGGQHSERPARRAPRGSSYEPKETVA
jgi:hypothetical protein